MATAQQDAPAKPHWRAPVGTINVVDPSPLNWLFITWNTMEEPIRTDEQGNIVYALATDARWLDDHTLELALRQGVRYQDGEPFTAHNIKQNFDEMQRWASPHPPGTWLNFPPSRPARWSTTTPYGSACPAPTASPRPNSVASISPVRPSGASRVSATRNWAAAKAIGE